MKTCVSLLVVVLAFGCGSDGSSGGKDGGASPGTGSQKDAASGGSVLDGSMDGPGSMEAGSADSSLDGGQSSDSGQNGGATDTPGCLPGGIEADCAGNATHQKAYLCNAQQNAQPEQDCVRPTSGMFAAMEWCCAHALCVRQLGTEYQCTMFNMPPKSYLCYDGAPLPDPGCVLTGNGIACCP